MQEAGHTVDTPRDVVAWMRHTMDALALVTISSELDCELLGRLCAGTDTSRRVIAMVDDESAVVMGTRALRTGARSVVPRGVTPEALRRTVEATIDGQAVMPATVADAFVLQVPTDAKGKPSIDQLSWLRDLANGTTVAQLAHRAGYSERVMFRLLKALYRQIGVDSRLQAIMHAREAGWL